MPTRSQPESLQAGATEVRLHTLHLSKWLSHTFNSETRVFHHFSTAIVRVQVAVEWF